MPAPCGARLEDGTDYGSRHPRRSSSIKPPRAIDPATYLRYSTGMAKKSSATETFPQRLLAIRQAAGLSQSALAAACGINERTVRAYERGEQTPPLSTLDALARALKINPSELIS